MEIVKANTGLSSTKCKNNLFYCCIEPLKSILSELRSFFNSLRGCYFILIFFICGSTLFTTCKQGCKEDGSSPGSSLIAGEKVKDIDGNIYSTVIIGYQEWMVENLKTTKFNNGTSIAYLGKSGEAKKTYCWYDNDIHNKNTVGALYNWYAVSDGKLAPKGWHVPDTAEWKMLIRYLGKNAIGKLQDTASGTWINPNPDASDSSGFKALPGGLGKIVQLEKSHYDFTGKGLWGGWWSSKDLNNKSLRQHFAFYMAKNSNTWQIFEQYEPEEYCLSVRCLKNTRPIVVTNAVSGISASSVVVNGNVLTNGGFPITSRGFCWYESQKPKARKSKTVKEKSLGPFTLKLTDLKPETIYRLKAFAKNKLGTAFGDEIEVVTKKN